ncbi:MAG: biotin/lipoyl-binding protein [Gracilimonas sp.]|uniref:HlyD family secretion protein n=1 Tax=Gracilimonas TaxID=649462 RepID=UPI001B16893E|nr:biotin/lipoyl-binding protein [Gracilimonas sp.]MBO6585661.1 biotin/lipoyl-binding protein [Gracilimonas sp.]MBO6616658.1 biotin/lipoyl-binding protein [Gracilimonas sp.]
MMLKKINSFYLFIALLFAGLFAVNSQYFKGSKSFVGVTYSKIYNINIEKPAVVKNVHVVPGQTVEPGEILVELESPQLNLEIQKLRKELEIYESQKIEQQKLLESELELLESQKRIIRNEIENEVELLQRRIQLNRSLTDSILANRTSNAEDDSLGTLQLQIKSIRQKGELELEAVNIRIADLEQDHTFDQSQLEAKIELARQELNWKMQEDRNLNKYATFPGVIESVYIKPNEQVQEFTSLISINPVNPTSVVGYLVGKKDRSQQLGQTVTVRSMEHPELQTTGSIIGFGSVVLLPEVLQKTTTIQTFGLEVFIEIPEKNDLPVGEKIIIR